MSIQSGKPVRGNKDHKDYDKWLDYNKGKMRRYRQRLHLAALQAYSSGGVLRCACSRCPEHINPHVEFLTLDHVAGGGNAHRRSLGAKTGKWGTSLALYKWLSDNNYPAGMFQILCHNCNAAKGDSIDHVCPHTNSKEKGISILGTIS